MNTIPDDIKAAFPTEIDLAIKPPVSIDVGSTAGKAGKAAKPIYPTLYISSVDGLDQLGDEGYALMYYKRKRLTQTLNDQGDTDHSADLEIQELCLPDSSEADDSGDLMDAAKSVAKGMGVDTGEPDSSAEGDETAEDETKEPAAGA